MTWLGTGNLISIPRIKLDGDFCYFIGLISNDKLSSFETTADQGRE